MTTWMFKKDGRLDGEIDDNLDSWKKWNIWMVKKMVIWMFEKDGHLDGEIDDNQVWQRANHVCKQALKAARPSRVAWNMH